MAISISSHSMSFSPLAIMTPTMISAAAVTGAVTTDSSGEKKIVSRNSAEVATELKPVRPPAPTPAADSM